MPLPRITLLDRLKTLFKFARYLALALIVGAIGFFLIFILPRPMGETPPADYANDQSWLCLPGRSDACATDLTATLVYANGAHEFDYFTADPAPKADCFYVYPTVSYANTANAPLEARAAEISVAQQQLARFGQSCRLFAPLYRQITLRGLVMRALGFSFVGNEELAYSDVKAAWGQFLAARNQDRPFILIGHSQGSRMLKRLIKEEVENSPAAARMVAAYLPGHNVLVPVGKDVGGDLAKTPICRSPRQTGCVIAYVSFRDIAPPPKGARFGQSADPAMEVACVNPAALSGGSAPLHGYFPVSGRYRPNQEPLRWTNPPLRFKTPFIRLPTFLYGQCVKNASGSYLAVNYNTSANDVRIRDIEAEVKVAGMVQADWGLHLVDMHLAIGTLAGLAKSQTENYLTKKARAAQGLPEEETVPPPAPNGP